MAIFENFPYTNFHELNLDWILQKMREMGIVVDNIPKTVSSEVEKQLEDANLNQIVYNALTTYGLVINVKAPPEGLTPAVGDGVTNDTAAIKACLEYAVENTNKIVFFPSGSYIISDTLDIDDDGICLLGFDKYNTILSYAGNTDVCIEIPNNIDKTQISGLTIKGSTTAIDDVIAINGANRVHDFAIKDCIIQNVSTGVSLSARSTTDEIRIENVTFKNIETGIELIRDCKLFINNVDMPSTINNTESRAIDIDANNAILNNISITGAFANGIILNGNNCRFDGVITNAGVPYTDNGTNNNFIIFR